MEKLIPLISDIQNIIMKSEVNLEISLPMIAVVGSQSTGKSSLLESIIGKQFLPKGKGIVTRRPIEIQLCQIHSDEQYAQFVEKKGEHYQNMDEFRKQIENQTNKQCGQNKGISTIPIRIRFCSKNVLNLLLIDLPGIVKNPTGDQPKDIEDQVSKMIKNYIKNPNCIIVAVTKATDDSANSQSLKMARQVDKDGIRTIGVLTQIDLVDQNINVLRDYSILSDKLTLGHTCVYLRPSKSSLTIQEQKQKQAQFFIQHAQYNNIAEKLGVKALIKTMNMVLVKHIKIQIPIIRENIIYLLENKKNKIFEYGAFDTNNDKKSQGILILTLLSKFVKHFIQSIQGKSTDAREAVIGGARIQFIFSQIYIKSINKLNPFEYLNDADIRTAIRNANGLRKSLFLPQAAFENLLRTQILRLKMPALQCSHLIHEQLRRLVFCIKVPQIERYQTLNKRIFEAMENLLGKALLKTQEMIRNIIQIQLGYINTNHPDFIDVISLVKTHPKNQEDSNLSFDSSQHHIDEPGFKFTKHKNKLQMGDIEQSQIIDVKLNKIKNNDKSRLKREQRVLIPKKIQDMINFYNDDSQKNVFPRYRLPCVPSTILVNENPKLREQTETEMIKKLIVSYFGVVKKNVNDSVPKTIVTFLVNHCKNSCEKMLVNSLYVQDQFESLLHEQQDIVNEREKLHKDLGILKGCLDTLNSLESELSI